MLVTVCFGTLNVSTSCLDSGCLSDCPRYPSPYYLYLHGNLEVNIIVFKVHCIFTPIISSYLIPL